MRTRSAGRRHLVAVFAAAAAAAGVARLAAAPPPTPSPVPTGSVKVSVLVVGPDKKAVPAVSAVAWIPGSKLPAGRGARPQVASKAKRFEPRIVALPAGTTVDFPNYDKIHHNVFSLSPTATFDLGLYKNGASRPFTFDNPGLVRIYCNIHPQMAAFLYVADGEIVGQTGADGSVVLRDVPVGRRPLRAWDEKGGDWSGTVDVAAGGQASVSIVLDGTTWRDLPHKNKYGKDYPPPDDDENRY